MALPAGQGLVPVTDSLCEQVPFPIWLLEHCTLTHLHLRCPLLSPISVPCLTAPSEKLVGPSQTCLPGRYPGDNDSSLLGTPMACSGTESIKPCVAVHLSLYVPWPHTVHIQ